MTAMATHRFTLLVFCLVACRSDSGRGDEDPCGVATSMRYDALRQLPSEMACESDDDCLVITTEIDCANVHLSDCGTLVNRTAQESLDWDRTEREICQAVEGTDFGCSVYAQCAALDAPHCEAGVCVRREPSAS